MPTPRRALATRPVPILRVQVLGGFSVAIGDRIIPNSAWPSRKAQQLVKILALAPTQQLTRDQVLDALWPEQDPDTLTGTFRQTSYLARRLIGRPDLLAQRSGSIILAPPGTYEIDAASFEHAATAARKAGTVTDYQAALVRYTGEVLPDERYADWALLAAERLRAIALTLRRELAALHETAGDEAAAEELWQQILVYEPTDEATHVALIRLHAHRGQRQRAVRQYHTLHTHLRDELGLAPDTATQRLYAAILSGRYPVLTPAETPTTTPEPLPPHALPTALTSLIGRADEIATVSALLTGPARVVTLIGTGGSGKSRLALAVAQALLPAYQDGMWWVSLAPLTDGTLVAATTAQLLGVRPQPDQIPTESLIAALRGKTLVLILDNAEHLRAACADLALRLLDSCPGVKILVTSRAPLRLIGEQRWRVPSLPLPNALSETVSPRQIADLMENDAAHLFMVRAALANPGFALTPQNAASIAAICRRLEGLPLALELAASWVSLLEPSQLVARLDNALVLLTGGPQGLPQRHQTLRATLDWSYGLLSVAEQRLLSRLAVFAGGWSLEAAEEVCGHSGGDVLIGLAGLVEHSLVQVETASSRGGLRYRLLEPTRQYALTKLATDGDEIAARESHAYYFLAFAELIEPQLGSQQQIAATRRLRREVDNLRAAMSWWSTRQEAEQGLRLAIALSRFWSQQEYIHEGWGWLSAFLRDAHTPIRPEIEARACTFLALLATILGTAAEGIRYGQRGEQLYKELHDFDGQAHACHYLGAIFRNSGDGATAQHYWEQAVRHYKQVGNQRGYIACTLNLGMIAFDRGEIALARKQAQTALPEIRAFGDLRLLAGSLLNLATYTLTARITTEVQELLTESINIATELDEQLTLLTALAELADLAALEGQWERAARLLGASQKLHQQSNLPIVHSVQPFHERTEAAARAALGAIAFNATYAAGQALGLEEAIREALIPRGGSAIGIGAE